VGARRRHARESEQDSQADVAACVAALLLCPLGWRAELVEYGTPEQTFSSSSNSRELASGITLGAARQYLLEQPAETDMLLRRLNVLLEVPQ
jgi:hypothetical protein